FRGFPFSPDSDLRTPNLQPADQLRDKPELLFRGDGLVIEDLPVEPANPFLKIGDHKLLRVVFVDEERRVKAGAAVLLFGWFLLLLTKSAASGVFVFGLVTPDPRRPGQRVDPKDRVIPVRVPGHKLLARADRREIVLPGFDEPLPQLPV